MRVKSAHIVYLLFLLLLVTLPFNSVFETIALFKGTMDDKTKPLTPLYLKLSKDIFWLGSIVLIAFAGGFSHLSKRLLWVYLVLLFILGFAAFAFLTEDTITVMVGVRSYLSIFFILFGFYCHRFDPIRIYPVLRGLLVFEVIIQVLESLYAPDYYGMMYMGFNLANPGTFLIPSTMASFAILVMYYAQEKNDNFTQILALISIFLARSSTTWLVVIFFYTIAFVKKTKLSDSLLAVILLISASFIFLNLDLVTGRNAIVENLITRWNIFAHHLQYPLGKGFGLGSGAAVLMQAEDSVIADSTLSSLLINFGWISFLLYFVFLYKAYLVFGYRNLLFLIFAGLSLTMIIFEMTPFIQFFFFEMGRQIYYSRYGTEQEEPSLSS